MAVSRLERAGRILDAAAELVLKWGYAKTTVDDVARLAEVAKGTIYLHWKTRDELFVALLRRERLAMLTYVREQVEQEGRQLTLRSTFEHLATGFVRTPLLKAVMVGDMDVLGKFGRIRDATESTAESEDRFAAYLSTLRDEKLVRTDLSQRELVNVVNGTFLGFFTVSPTLPRTMRMDEDDLTGLMAESVTRMLARGRALNASEAKTFSRVTIDHFHRAEALAERKYREVIGLGHAAAEVIPGA